MILRRVIQHFRKQEWTAIAIDFVIVVLGVFVGMQVNNWNVAQSERVESEKILERLEQDFELVLARTDRSLAQHENRLAATRRLIRGAQSGRLAEDTLLEDLRLCKGFSTPPGPSTTFTELVSGGNVRLLKNAELRRAISEYNDYVGFVRSQFGFFTNSLSGTRDAITPATRLRISDQVKTAIADIGQIDTVDRARLLGDPDIQSGLQVAYITHENIFAILSEIRKRITDIQALIKAEQEKAS